VKLKPSAALRFLGGLAATVVILGFVVLRVTSCAPLPAPAPGSTAGAPSPAPPPAAPSAPSTPACQEGPTNAAASNARSLRTLAWSPFGRAEAGWEIYAPLIAREIGTGCAPETPGFAGALADWQGRHRLTPDGVLSDAGFAQMKGVIQMRRPFVRIRANDFCPAAPADSRLTWADKSEGYGGKLVQLRTAALAAYRRMAAAAKADDPRIAADPRNLTLFSAFRSPDYDAARCAKEGNCNGIVRATCSAHRTGLAMDLYVGQAPGFEPDSSADPNRLFMSRTPAYRWLVAHADEYGFVPYPFEPWHWEWTGEAP
jgi:D-alanyl-D-alanine carboxypeptidase